MRRFTVQRVLVVLGALLVLVGSSVVSALQAQAIGAEVYRANQSGQPAGTISKVGNTGPACCCINHGNGTVGVGVKVCYLPIP